MSRLAEFTLSIAIIVLAAGRSSRMGQGGHKLLATFARIPLVRRSALVALGSDASSVTVVTGYRNTEVEVAVGGLALTLVHNPDFATGIASSIRRGFACETVSRADGVLIMLADMPHVSATHLNALMSAFHDGHGRAIVRAVSSGRPGNPVILPRSLYSNIKRLKGDIGARDIIAASRLALIEVEHGGAAGFDVDTPADLIHAGGVPQN